MDIFDQKIVCKHCNKQMRPQMVEKKGMKVRSVACKKCGVEIIHPSDQVALDQYGDLKGKTFMVKLRTVGNSHAVSIPKEIVRFINETHRQMGQDMDNTMRRGRIRSGGSRDASMIDQMVRLCFEDFGRLSMRFGDVDTRRGDR